MTFASNLRAVVKALAVVLALAVPAALTISAADARVCGGYSSGSRGARTFSAPPSTSTAPGTAQPFNRTITQPSTSPGYSPGLGGGFFNRPGRGLLGGLAAGFLGAGLFGLLFGGGLFSGIGGFSSILGLLLQIVLIVFLARMAMSWWQRRQMGPAYAGSGLGQGPSQGSPMGLGGFGFGSSSAPPEIQPADYETFERLLIELQDAYSNEDVARLGRVATPEMVSYFVRDLDANRARNQVNKVADTKLLQGDLSEAWREGDNEYASVAMRYSLIDRMLDRSSGQVVSGGQPEQVTEVWTFMRPRGGNWILSAIQQTN